eukprot:3205076-Prymnesium_polylepis.1
MRAAKKAPLAGYMSVRLDGCTWSGAQILLDITVTTQSRSGPVEHTVRREYRELVGLEAEMLRIGHLVKPRLVPLEPKGQASQLVQLDAYATVVRALLSRAIGRTETAQWTSPAVVREFLRTQDRLLGTRRPKTPRAARPDAEQQPEASDGPTGEDGLSPLDGVDTPRAGPPWETPFETPPPAGSVRHSLLGRVVAAANTTGSAMLHQDGGGDDGDDAADGAAAGVREGVQQHGERPAPME